MRQLILSLTMTLTVTAAQAALSERAPAYLENALAAPGAAFDGLAPAPGGAAAPAVEAGHGTGERAAAPVLTHSGVHAPEPPRRHIHHWNGVPETDPSGNVVSGASAIRGAGMTGHLINVLPPAALYGAVRSWSEALAGERGEGARKATLTATIIVPIGAMMIGTLALFSMIDNAWNAAEDGLAGRFGVTHD